jgi:hypothetical protein
MPSLRATRARLSPRPQTGQEDSVALAAPRKDSGKQAAEKWMRALCQAFCNSRRRRLFSWMKLLASKASLAKSRPPQAVAAARRSQRRSTPFFNTLLGALKTHIPGMQDVDTDPALRALLKGTKTKSWKRLSYGNVLVQIPKRLKGRHFVPAALSMKAREVQSAKPENPADAAAAYWTLVQCQSRNSTRPADADCIDAPGPAGDAGSGVNRVSVYLLELSRGSSCAFPAPLWRFSPPPLLDGLFRTDSG